MKFNWDEHINDTVIISLKEREDRKRLLDPRLGKIKFEDGSTLKDHSRYFDAIDPTMLGDFPDGIQQKTYPFDYHYVIDEREGIKHLYNTGFMLDSTETEIAICHSHYSVWKHIVDNKIPMTLITEDDVVFEYGFAKKMGELMTEDFPEDCELLYLSYDITESLTAEKYNKSVYRAYKGLWWLSGYMLSYEGAKKLLDRLPIIGPVDMWINHHFNDLNVYVTIKPLIWQSRETDSSNTWSFTKNQW